MPLSLYTFLKSIFLRHKVSFKVAYNPFFFNKIFPFKDVTGPLCKRINYDKLNGFMNQEDREVCF